MIIGAGKKLKKIRTVLSNDINDIYICQNINDITDNNYYTLIRIYDADIIKDVLEIIYDENGNYTLPSSLFYDLFVEVDTLNIVMKYFEPRKLFSYLKSYMNNDYEQHKIIQNFLYQCLTLDVKYPILDLILDKDNVNLDDQLNVFFNGFLDFSKFDKNVTEEKCVRKCSDLIDDILMSNEELTNNSGVKSINLFIMKKRNNNYEKMIDLYNDFKIKEDKYKDGKGSLFDRIKEIFEDILENKLKKIIFVGGLIIIILALIIFICNLFKIDLPFTGYKGMEHIGTINMGEK